MPKRWNLLCVKPRSTLNLGEILLYEPYKNILFCLREFCVDPNAIEFDPVAKVYDGLLSVPTKMRPYYESLLGVTSYYHHSQGGKGRYLEKKIASSFEGCSVDIELSKLPLWLEQPDLHRKKGLFTQRSLTDEEKETLRTTQWNWCGGQHDKDVVTDVGCILKEEKTIVLMEVKNRVDSGGTAGRREIWASDKFGTLVEYLESNKKLFERKSKKYSIPELLSHFGFENLEIYIGVLFDTGDSPATVESDKAHGFYSSSQKGFKQLATRVEESASFEILSCDMTNLQVQFKHQHSPLKVTFGALYGNDIPLKLFRQNLPVEGLLLLTYDDMWLALTITIDERAVLLKQGRNFTTIFTKLLDSDEHLREEFNLLIKSKCGQSELTSIIRYLIHKHGSLFDQNLLPPGKDRIEHLSNVLQFLCAVEA
jgi:hypothetical protein